MQIKHGTTRRTWIVAGAELDSLDGALELGCRQTLWIFRLYDASLSWDSGYTWHLDKAQAGGEGVPCMLEVENTPCQHQP